MNEPCPRVVFFCVGAAFGKLRQWNAVSPRRFSPQHLSERAVMLPALAGLALAVSFRFNYFSAQNYRFFMVYNMYKFLTLFSI